MNDKPSPLLRCVARALNIATSYKSQKGEHVRTPTETLKNFIKILEPDFSFYTFSDDELKEFLKRKRKDFFARAIRPVYTAWDGQMPTIWVSVPAAGKLTLNVHGRDDKQFEYVLHESENSKKIFEGTPYYRIKIETGHVLDFGYYDLDLRLDDKVIGRSFLISAPKKLPSGPKEWGLFAPIYALKSGSSDIGSYDDLGAAMKLVKKYGGSFLGTLPLLPIDYESGKKSPYMPFSRLFINEIYLPLKHRGGQQSEIDYDSVYKGRKEILSREAKEFFEKYPDGNDNFKEFISGQTLLEEYAEFRSKGNKQKRDFHLYSQYLCYKKMRALKKESDEGRAASLYLDYPIGVDPDGFDAHKFSHLFLNDFSVGAPPDAFFSEGQDWGFKAFNPQKLIEDKFLYLRKSLENYFSYANMLRLDHVMGFYRIYCIPAGASGKEGGYIYYPFDAIMAVFCLEADQHKAALIGEDLGTVPEAVEKSMEAHGLYRMWLLQFEMKERPENSFENIKPHMLACMNTHDLFPLQAFMNGEDFKKISELKLMKDKDAKNSHEERKNLLKNWDKDKLFLTSLEKMAQSEARYLLLNIEDFWQETAPQNIPGTLDEYPNWRRRLKFNIEEWEQQNYFQEAVKILDKYRHTS